MKKDGCDWQRDYETAIPALRRINDMVESEGKESKESKDLVRVLHLPKDKHPSPTFLGEEETEGLISHLISFIGVMESDFKMVKTELGKEDPRNAEPGVIFTRFYVGRFRSRMLEKKDEFVIKELRTQKAEDLGFLIYRVTSGV